MNDLLGKPDGETAPTWDEIYASYFHRLSARDIQAWEYELFKGEKRIRAITMDLLIDAIRRCAREAEKDNDGNPRPAKLEAVRSMVFEMLRERSPRQPDAPAADCAVCLQTGFICGVRYLHDSATRRKIVGVCASVNDCQTKGCPHNDGATVCYDLAVPCKCSLGQQKLEAYRENASAIRRLQDMAWKVKGL